MIAVLKSYIGVPYKKGGMSHAGIDCSGLAVIAYASQGIDIPRTASEMSKAGHKVKGDSFVTGDLLFFNTKPLAGVSPCVWPFRFLNLSIPLLYGQTHVGIYLEDGKFVHASVNKGVIVSYMESPYWQKRFVQARRIL
ncbi:MAG: C40 family peptidase [Pseudomonadota bacterium]